MKTKKPKSLKSKEMALKMAVLKVRKSITRESDEGLEMQSQFFTEILKIIEEERGKRNGNSK